jgi:hypothetical protein
MADGSKKLVLRSVGSLCLLAGRLCLMQSFAFAGFDELAFRYIAGDFGSTDDGTRPIAYRRNGQGDVDDLSVFPDSLCFIVLNPFATADSLQNRPVPRSDGRAG